jgi:formate hydrogenlyase transcriptional activator
MPDTEVSLLSSAFAREPTVDTASLILTPTTRKGMERRSSVDAAGWYFLQAFLALHSAVFRPPPPYASSALKTHCQSLFRGVSVAVMPNTEIRCRDDWRRALNRAVRQCASSFDGLDDHAVSVALTTMLAEVGDTLGVDCAAFVELLPETQDNRCHDWVRPDASSQPPVPASTLVSLVHGIRVERALIVLRDYGADCSRVPGGTTWLRRAALQSAVVVPAGVGVQPTCAWALGTRGGSYNWSESLIEHLQVLGDVLAAALDRRMQDVPFESASASPARSAGHFDAIVGDSPAIRAALSRLEKVATTESTVLLLGETGTGKELFARALHASGRRRAAPIVSVNCAALPATLIESELFGHQRGAFTGAVGLRQGRFELAHRGTLFLDEIGDLALDLQAKLLRVLQEGAFERLGSSHSQTVDVRIITATHQDLAQRVATGAFRADLFYRLNVFPIRLPALRERREDIPAIVWSIIRRRQQVLQRRIIHVPDHVMVTLKHRAWPGNIRELENVVERALIHSTGDTLTLLDEGGDDAAVEDGGDITTLASVERMHIQEVLGSCGWRINGFGNAAERLGLHPNTLRFRMKKLGIVRHETIRMRRPAVASQADLRKHAS